MFVSLLVGATGGLTASALFHYNAKRHSLGLHNKQWNLWNDDDEYFHDDINNESDSESTHDINCVLNYNNFAHRARVKLPFELTRNDYEVLALVKPTLEHVMNSEEDIKPIKAIVIGGGYSGARLSYLFDSLFDVTLIDTKNFFELTDDIVAFIANKWDDEKNVEALHKMMVLHRYYLKRANVLTGKVNKVDAQEVYLHDGRHVPYDLLFITTGESKSFPFETQQRTRAGRREELKHFNKFLENCHKIAIVGGGPTGTQLAAELAWTRPDAEIHVFHHGQELLPRLQRRCRQHAENYLRNQPNVHLHLASNVTKVDCTVDDTYYVESVNDCDVASNATAESVNSNTNSNNETNNLCTFHTYSEQSDKALRVSRKPSKHLLFAKDANESLENTNMPESESSLTSGVIERMTKLLPFIKEFSVSSSGSSSSSKINKMFAPNSKVKYTVHFDEYERKTRLQESVLHQLYFGINFGDSIRTRNSINGMNRTYQPPSSLSTSQKKLQSTSEGEFDYVFSLMGNIPRPISSYDTLCNLQENSNEINDKTTRDNILCEHQVADGHYRVSRMLELFALPHIFAVGKCNNLPLVKSYGMSDTQCRAVLRAMTSLLYDRTKTSIAEHNKLIVSRMQTPRLNIRLGYRDAVGSTPWGGGIVGMSAIQEYALERNYLLRDFLQPTFFKRQDPLSVMKKINAWKECEITDVKDFSFAESVINTLTRFI